MSWKTNPVINRVKHTMGWEILPLSTYKQHKFVYNTHSFRNLLFFKNWLKLRRWHLLELQQIQSQQERIWFITALRIPKRNFSYNHPIQIFTVDQKTAQSKHKSLNFNKHIKWAKLNFRRRKKLFKFIKNEHAVHLVKGGIIKKINSKTNYKKNWLELLGNIYTNSLFRKENSLFKTVYKLNQTVYNFTKLRKKVYAKYDFYFRDWVNIKSKKNIKTTNKDMVFLDIIAKNYWNKKKGTKNNFKKKVLKYKKFTGKSILKYFQKILNRRLTKNKINYYTNFKKYQLFSKNKKRQNTSHKIRRITLNKIKNSNTRTKFNSEWTFKVFVKKNIYHPKFTKKLIRKRLNSFKKRKKTLALRKYIAWRKKYLRVITIKELMFKNFFKLLHDSLIIKRKIQPYYKKYLQNKWKIKRTIFKHELIENAKYNAHLRRFKKRKTIRSTSNRYKQNSLFKWNLILKIHHLQKLEKRIKYKKFYNYTHRLNWLFKKIVHNVLNQDKEGQSIVKFLHPVRHIFSMRKYRKIVAQNRAIKRYKRQRVYKRMIPIFAMLHRYWHPQPLLEQIAFEMEKTKRHWPLLKTIRALIAELKPIVYGNYRIAIRGKINSSDRTRVFFIKQGRIPLNSFHTRMVYGIWHSNARTGSFSIKGWLYLPR